MIYTKFYHCDGIICLFLSNKILLWNPALRESKCLPPLDDIYIYYDDMIDSRGFGYDLVANDCKVLCVCKADLVRIYSMKTGPWREMRMAIGLDGGDYVRGYMEVCYKGVCYCEAEKTASLEMWLIKSCSGRGVSDSSLWNKYPKR
ncbi:F-box associated interaction domain containing protein [Parasponia andersonii]|uniref:F-box associated interaction domain containing protein n=1 Tax=Parasponia andersonii TaxID=3476 RepID=A0A2P5AHH5_PARAD|nr:F-box associated interaction domain containing protein [Parasponia andersonii]